jgi:hypothetical protein
LWAYSNPNRYRDAYGNSDTYGNGGAEGYSYTAGAADAGSSRVTACL